MSTFGLVALSLGFVLLVVALWQTLRAQKRMRFDSQGRRRVGL